MAKLIRSARFRVVMIAAAATVVATGAVLVILHSSAAAQEPPAAKAEGETAVPVRVSEVRSGAIASYLTAAANLVPENDVKVLAEAEGRVQAVRVEEGDHVAAGQVLALLARDEAEITVNKARLRESEAARAFERARETSDKGLISREELDRLATGLDVTRQELAEADWRLSRATIRAPFAGRITERLVNPGQHVRPGEAVFAVADFDPLVARVFLPEKDVLHLSVGQPARITLAADGECRFAGRIRQISPVVDVATGTVKVTVEAVEPPPEVRPGAFVSLAIVREERNAAVLLPREAVVRELGQAHVYVAADERAARRPVTLGIEEGEVVEVVSGVSPGDLVVVAGHGSLKAGTKVTTVAS